ncbi:STAS domain-containing protein [bacterium]|nr:STAS domain-containing protein [bacterium]
MWGSLEIERNDPKEDGTVVYRLAGSLSYGDPGSRFVEGVKGDLEGGVRSIELDLAKLERIDSGGIGLLAAVMASARNVDAEIHLTGLPHRYQKLFRAVGLSGVFGLEDPPA